MKEYTENELRNKAEVYCLAAERCPSEVEAKLQQWGASRKLPPTYWNICRKNALSIQHASAVPLSATNTASTNGDA